MTTTTTAIAALAVLVLLVLALSLKIITQYERGIVFRLGRLRPVYDPGLHLVVPFLERLVRVDTRVVTLTIPPQEVITEDNVPARVNAVVLFNVTDPVKAVMAVENYAIATSQIAQTTLRSVLGRVDLDTVLAHRGALNEELRQAADTLSKSPASLQLRYLQTLLELGADQNSTVVFPLPMDIIGPLLERFGPQGGLPEANEGEGGEGAGAPRHR